MTITITKKDNDVTIELHNEKNGNDVKLDFTAEDARMLAFKIYAVLADLP